MVRVALVTVLVLSSSGTCRLVVVRVVDDVTCLDDGCHSPGSARRGSGCDGDCGGVLAVSGGVWITWYSVARRR